jgi:hypothetical protein
MGGRSGIRLLAAAAVAAMAIAAAPPAASAAGTTASVGVVTGSLTLLSVSDVDFGVVRQDGADHTPRASGRYDVSDGTASGAGWHLSITGTQFTDAGGHTLPAATAEGASSACDGGSSCTPPQNQVGYPLAIPVDGSTITLFSAGVDSGKGNQTATVDYSEYVSPASASGFYHAAWDITLSSAP